MHPHKIISKVFSCLHRESGKKNTRVAAINVKDTITGIVAYTLNGNHYVSVKSQDLGEFYPAVGLPFACEGDPYTLGLQEKGVTLIGREEARSDADDDLIRSMISSNAYPVLQDEVPTLVKDAFIKDSEEETGEDQPFSWVIEEWSDEEVAPFIALCTRAEFKKSVKGRENLAAAFISTIDIDDCSFRTATQGHYLLQRDTESNIDLPLFVLEVVKRIGKMVTWQFLTQVSRSNEVPLLRLAGLTKDCQEVEVVCRDYTGSTKRPDTSSLQKHFDWEYLEESESALKINGQHLMDFLLRCAATQGKKFTDEEHILLSFFVDNPYDNGDLELNAQFALYRDPAPNTKFAAGEDSSGKIVLLGNYFILPGGMDTLKAYCDTNETLLRDLMSSGGAIDIWPTEWRASYLSTLASSIGEVVTFIVSTTSRSPCSLIGTEGSALVMPKVRH